MVVVRRIGIFCLGHQVEQLLLVAPHEVKVDGLRALNHTITHVYRLIAVKRLARVLYYFLLFE